MSKNNRWFAGIFIFIGFSMLALWTMLLFTNQVPELAAAPFTTITHISAESLTGLMLILAGVALFKEWAWAKNFSFAAVGMLFYAVVQATGYYIDHNGPFFVGMFILMIILCVVYIRSKVFK